MNRISIITPVHNKEAYIKKTLNSILLQTYPHFELILVDDGSTDKSGIICDQYALINKRIKVIHQNNKGVSAARNIGIRASKYSLIAFIDADDYWDTTFLEQMSELILTFPDASIYSAKYACVKNNKILFNENIFPYEEEKLVFNLIDKCCKKARFPIHTSSVIIKKDAIREVGCFDERINVFEDFDLFLRIALLSKVAFLNCEPLSFYNTDVPNESKERGLVPLLSKNWICFMDKFDTELDKNKNLKLLLDRARLNQMISYRRHFEYREQVKSILSKVNKSNYGWKFKVIFKLPVWLGDFILSFYKILIKIKNFLS